MLYVTYADTAANLGDQHLGIDVSEIKLELNRVIEQNAIENGLMVPAWNFYGRIVLTDSNNNETIRPGFYGDGRSEILLSINAIDGSIIESSRGY